MRKRNNREGIWSKRREGESQKIAAYLEKTKSAYFLMSLISFFAGIYCFFLQEKEEKLWSLAVVSVYSLFRVLAYSIVDLKPNHRILAEDARKLEKKIQRYAGNGSRTRVYIRNVKDFLKLNQSGTAFFAMVGSPFFLHSLNTFPVILSGDYFSDDKSKRILFWRTLKHEAMHVKYKDPLHTDLQSYLLIISHLVFSFYLTKDTKGMSKLGLAFMRYACFQFTLVRLFSGLYSHAVEQLAEVRSFVLLHSEERQIACKNTNIDAEKLKNAGYVALGGFGRILSIFFMPNIPYPPELKEYHERMTDPEVYAAMQARR